MEIIGIAGGKTTIRIAPSLFLSTQNVIEPKICASPCGVIEKNHTLPRQKEEIWKS
jgi:hypothetical protein